MATDFSNLIGKGATLHTGTDSTPYVVIGARGNTIALAELDVNNVPNGYTFESPEEAERMNDSFLICKHTQKGWLIVHEFYRGMYQSAPYSEYIKVGAAHYYEDPTF